MDDDYADDGGEDNGEMGEDEKTTKNQHRRRFLRQKVEVRFHMQRFPRTCFDVTDTHFLTLASCGVVVIVVGGH